MRPFCRPFYRVPDLRLRVRRSRWPGRSAGCRPVAGNWARQKAREPVHRARVPEVQSSPLQRGVCELSVPCGASNFSSGRQQRVGLWPSPEDPLSPGTGAIRRAAPTAGGTPRTLSLNTRLGFGRSNDISYRRVKLSRISVAFGAQVGAAAVRFAASGLPTRSRGIEQGRFRVPFAPLDRDPAAISRTR